MQIVISKDITYIEVHNITVKSSGYYKDMSRYRYAVIFISLLHLITATGVYYVTPDDQSDTNNDCPIDHECHTLQYYLLNSSKYFTSNTQLHFLQGNF